MVEVGPGFGYGLGLYTTTTPCGQVRGHDGGDPDTGRSPDTTRAG
jgi:hypothetical protein